MRCDGHDDSGTEYASPPCFLHELDPSYLGSTAPLPPEQIGPWRKRERERLLRQRQAVPSGQRRHWDAAIVRALRQRLADVRSAVVSAYWPIRGEPDLRPLLAELTAAGARIALPLVVDKGRPLLFKEWRQGARLERGVWGIPFPAEGAVVRPDLLLVPVLGFDRAAYRLGYGGGYFDRTLAELADSARAIGVGYGLAEIPTIHPQPHDIAMDLVVTESCTIKSAERSRRRADGVPAGAAGGAAPRSGP